MHFPSQEHFLNNFLFKRQTHYFSLPGHAIKLPFAAFCFIAVLCIYDKHYVWHSIGCFLGEEPLWEKVLWDFTGYHNKK